MLVNITHRPRSEYKSSSLPTHVKLIKGVWLSWITSQLQLITSCLPSTYEMNKTVSKCQILMDVFKATPFKRLELKNVYELDYNKKVQSS